MIGDFFVGAVPYGYVYEIVNLTNGKTYVGSRKLSKDRAWRQYMGSGKLIKQAILKYGADSFRKRFVGYALTPESLYELETEWIIRQQGIGLAQYNLFSGGHAGGDTFSRLKSKTLDEVRRKQSEGIKRHLQTAKVWNSGQTTLTDPRLLAQSERAIASGTYRGMNRGSKRSEETRARMSESGRGNQNSQSNQLEENRVRIGLANRRKITPSGLTGIELHDQMLSMLEAFEPGGVSFKSYSTALGYSYTTVRMFSYSHGVTSRGEECLLCLTRESYPDLLTPDELNL